ncbi:MAG TPA: hypothetical protein VF618_25420 [Thermoanaerobaculia bacterium]
MISEYRGNVLNFLGLQRVGHGIGRLSVVGFRFSVLRSVAILVERSTENQKPKTENR